MRWENFQSCWQMVERARCQRINTSKNLFTWVKRTYLMENANIHLDLATNNTTMVPFALGHYTKRVLIVLALIFHYVIMWAPLKKHQRKKREEGKWVSSVAGRTNMKAPQQWVRNRRRKSYTSSLQVMTHPDNVGLCISLYGIKVTTKGPKRTFLWFHPANSVNLEWSDEHETRGLLTVCKQKAHGQCE